MPMGTGYNSTVITANTAGQQVMAVGASNAQQLSAPIGTGLLHTLTFGGDTTAETLTLYDGSSTSGTVKFKAVAPANAIVNLVLDIQFNNGIFAVLSGGTAPAVTLSWT